MQHNVQSCVFNAADLQIVKTNTFIPSAEAVYTNRCFFVFSNILARCSTMFLVLERLPQKNNSIWEMISCRFSKHKVTFYWHFQAAGYFRVLTCQGKHHHAKYLQSLLQ